MTINDIMEPALDRLRRRRRMPYHILKRQFTFDDNALTDLKAEILDTPVFRSDITCEVVDPHLPKCFVEDIVSNMFVLRTV